MIPYILEQRYRSLLRDVASLSLTVPEFMPPHLIEAPDSWELAPIRLFYIGQETRGWPYDDQINSLLEAAQRPDALDLLLESYRNFDFAKIYPTLNRAPFWRFFHNLTNEQATIAKLWTNIFKTAGPDQGRHSLLHYSSNIQRTVLQWQQGVLHDEIRAFDPTHLVFVTGPQYDHFIKDCLGDFDVHSLFGRPPRFAASLSFKNVKVPAVRIYHPGYAQRIGLFDDLLIAVQQFLR